MSLTIYDVLQLEICKNFRIVSGIKGLSNIIKRVGILDHETGELVYETFTEGQFVLTTLYVIKDDINKLKELVNMMISVGVCGLAIRSVYFDNIPEDVIELANGNDFPIMLYNNVYFEDVFAGILTAMKEKDEKRLIELRIDSLLYGNPDNALIRSIALELNSNFRENHIVTYCKLRNADEAHISSGLLNIKLEDKLSKLIPYKEGYIIIHTFEKGDTNQIDNIVSHRISRWFASFKKYAVGISSVHCKLEELKESLKESMFALTDAIIYEKEFVKFSNIGVNKILLPLIDNEWITKYYTSLISPIQQYDEKNSTELLNTALHYVKNNGSIKATATELCQHENTIRYRLERINSILNGVCNNDNFYEELAIAIRIHNIKSSIL